MDEEPEGYVPTNLENIVACALIVGLMALMFFLAFLGLIP